MSDRPLAVLCVSDSRLNGLCTVLLRHAGFRIVEVHTVEEAVQLAESKPVELLIAGEAADPDGRLSALAERRDITCFRLGAHVELEALLKLFETIKR